MRLEERLRDTNTQVPRRFAHIAQYARNAGQCLSDVTLREQEAL